MLIMTGIAGLAFLIGKFQNSFWNTTVTAKISKVTYSLNKRISIAKSYCFCNGELNQSMKRVQDQQCTVCQQKGKGLFKYAGNGKERLLWLKGLWRFLYLCYAMMCVLNLIQLLCLPIFIDHAQIYFVKQRNFHTKYQSQCSS